MLTRDDRNLSSGDLELELAQKDIEITQLHEHIQKLDKQLLNENSATKQELALLSEQLLAEVATLSFSEYSLIILVK